MACHNATLIQPAISPFANLYALRVLRPHESAPLPRDKIFSTACPNSMSTDRYCDWISHDELKVSFAFTRYLLEPARARTEASIAGQEFHPCRLPSLNQGFLEYSSSRSIAWVQVGFWVQEHLQPPLQKSPRLLRASENFVCRNVQALTLIRFCNFHDFCHHAVNRLFHSAKLCLWCSVFVFWMRAS